MQFTSTKKSVLFTLLALLIAGGFFNSSLGQESYGHLKDLGRPIAWPIKMFLFHPPLEETPETREIAALLKVVKIYGENGPIPLRRIGRDFDGGYVVPETVIQKADAVFGYGISDDISFEEETASRFGKPSWGFDGTCPPVATHHPLCHFVPQCIVSEQAYLQNPDKNGTFAQQIAQFGLESKKLFIKMDIEGNEYDTLPDILRHAKNVTGLVLEIHFTEDSEIPQALALLKNLSDHFHLVHVHGNNCCLEHFVTSNAKGAIPRVLELTYINKDLVSRYELSQDQSHPTPLDMPNASKIADLSFTILEDSDSCL